MFTGIITNIGEVLSVERRGDARFRIGCDYEMGGIDFGASIACAGVCLTVVDKGAADGRGWFDVDVSTETLAKTSLGDWRAGTRVNLERALRLGDEMGGHIVTGHVDGTAIIAGIRAEGDSTRVSLTAPAALAPFIAQKGSVALDGTSLTVNEVEGETFGINLIPHTKACTTWGGAETGRRVNLEIDILARYVARLDQTRKA